MQFFSEKDQYRHGIFVNGFLENKYKNITNNFYEYIKINMVVKDVTLLITSIVFLLVGVGLISWWSNRAGHFNFLRKAHYYSLVLLVIAGGLTWVGLIYPVNPDKFEVSGKQWIALAFSLLISVFWWLRYILSISPNTELVEAENEEDD